MKKYLAQKLASQEDVAVDSEVPRKKVRKSSTAVNIVSTNKLSGYAQKLSINTYEKFARKFIHECNRQCEKDMSAFLRSHLCDNFCHIGRHYDREKASNPAPYNQARLKNYYEIHGVADFVNYFTGYFAQFPDCVFRMEDVHIGINVSKRRSTLVFAYQATTTVCHQLPVNPAVLTHPESKATDAVPATAASPDEDHIPLNPTNDPHFENNTADSTSVEETSSDSADSVCSSDIAASQPMDMEIIVRGYIVMQFEEYDVQKVSHIDFHYYLSHMQPVKQITVI